MNSEEQMSINERRKYLRLIQRRYQEAGRKAKSELLDEAATITGLHRKSLIRLLKGDLKRKPRQRQRGRTYGLPVQRALTVISESVDHICAERLQPNLVWLAQHLEQHDELSTTPELLQQLSQVSISTVRRMLQRVQQDQPTRPRSTARGARQVAQRVPVKRIAWDEQEPGHIEVDLVHHCGTSTEGHYVHSLQMVDVATGWSERVAILGRSYRVMQDGFRRILARQPFPIHHLHSDNGGEFLNDHMLRFWEEEIGGVELSRGRPAHKNDQRFVEQKNGTLIRAVLGYDRFDTVVHTQFLNLLYNKMWLYHNFFQPVMRLKEKTVVKDKGSYRVIRRHDQARTPFDRLCQTGALSTDKQDRLEALRQRTNPRQLKQESDALRETIWSLPGAKEGETEDIFKTLMSKQEEQRLRRWADG